MGMPPLPYVPVARAHVLSACGRGAAWGDEAEEALALTRLYGEAGERTADARVVAMLDEPAPVTIGMQAKRYLELLREVHREWEAKAGAAPSESA